jgi:hypothetical protein
MRRIRRHLSFANVASAIALFVALGGGTAVALSGSTTVQSDDLGPGAQVKAPDLADNTVNGADVVNGSLGLSDLNPTSRPHKLEYTRPAELPTTTLAKYGHLELRAECQDPSVNGQTTLFIRLLNRAVRTGTLNGVFSSQTTGPSGPVSWRGIGGFVGGEGHGAYLQNNDVAPNALARGEFNRVEGQVVFQTPGEVTTIDFHALTTGPSNPRCEFYGTAVTSNLS